MQNKCFLLLLHHLLLLLLSLPRTPEQEPPGGGGASRLKAKHNKRTNNPVGKKNEACKTDANCHRSEQTGSCQAAKCRAAKSEEEEEVPEEQEEVAEEEQEEVAEKSSTLLGFTRLGSARTCERSATLTCKKKKK